MHRYGRHGPRAWLKWRWRHIPRPSSLPVPVNQKLVVFHIRIPQEAERVLVVLDQPNEGPEVAIMPNFLPMRYLPGPEPKEYEHVKRAAKRQAISDVDMRGQEEAAGSVVVIDWKKLEEYVKGNYATQFFNNHTSLPDDSKEDVIQLYWETYRDHYSTNSLSTIEDEKDRKLFHLAKQDSNDLPPVRSDGKVAYHKEYGYIIRALEVMGVIPEGTFNLLRENEPHDLADKYGFFCKYHESITVWPLDSFRTRRWLY
jgi:hypothetical protein